MNIELFPLEKVVIDGKTVKLGMEQAAVEALIGEGKRIRNRYYYYGSEMAIDYDSDERAEFIEFLGGELQPVIYGVSAFEVFADELFELLKQKNCGEIIDNERGYCYCFPNISVGVYRECIPDDVEEMIEEAKADGEPLDENEIAEERRRAEHWATIGIGSAGYYRK